MAAVLPSQSLPTTAGESATAAAAGGDSATTAAADLTIAHKHSLYDDMILSAIAALEAGKGSSWFAISKYISVNYSDLPPTHATILTDRLQELQSKGVIRMLKHGYKLEDGSRKRGRPPKSISSPKPNSISPSKPNSISPSKPNSISLSKPNSISSSKPNSISSLKPNVDVTKKRKRGRPLKGVGADQVANGPVYIVSQAEQLSSGVLKGFPGAVAIVLPKSLLTERAARGPILIMPKGIQSLIDASAGEKKLGRPKNVDVERRRGRPRKKALIHGDVNGKALNVVAKGPGRPWKIRDLLVPGNGDEMLQKSGEVVKRSVGRPRKKPIS